LANSANGWCPTEYIFTLRSTDSSTGVARIRTDVGEAFIKALGNPVGPHALVREFLGTALAEWMSLRTFDYAIFEVGGTDRIRLGHARDARPGPAFVARAEKGISWFGDDRSLESVVNIEQVAGIIVLDTLILNWDRCPPIDDNRRPNYGNIFLSLEGGIAGQFEMVTIDHTHCLGGGQELSRRLLGIEAVKDDRIFGAFPQFARYVKKETVREAVSKLRSLNDGVLTRILDHIPRQWSVSDSLRDHIRSFLVQRAAYLADNIEGKLIHFAGVQGKIEL